ncbi:MAG TPA: dihydropteroate synthase, partial [Thermoanaerobaculia bacterium]|nr:dihydropteroate synthase [Thermoanaerobaculia bacterium]
AAPAAAAAPAAPAAAPPAAPAPSGRPERRLAGSLAALAWATAAGAAIVRVHDVPESVSFLAAWRAIAEAGP